LLISFFASNLGPVVAAAHNSSLDLYDLLATASSGIAEATAVRVGYHIGRGAHRAARRTAALALAAATVWGALFTAFILSSRPLLARLFSDDDAVVHVTSTILLYAAPAYTLFSVAMAGSGVLEGSSRSGTMLAIFGGSTWLVGAPLAVVAAKATTWGVEGLWGAAIAAYAVATVGVLVVIACSDWRTLTADAAAAAAAAAGDHACEVTAVLDPG
jgi:MATE family multidrug resistance protein